MAVVNYTVVNAGHGYELIEWTPLLNTDTGQIYKPSGYFGDKSVHVSGTFSVGGTVVIEGSNWGLTEASPAFITLVDPHQNPLSFTATALEAVLENVMQIRPRVSAGDGSTSLTVRLLVTTIARG